MKKPVALIILDGWGHRTETENNAIASAQKPFFDSLWAKYPHSLLKASEDAVGLPAGQVGNSEIGHMTIGAGKVIDTDLVKISKAIDDKTFFQNDILKKTIEFVAGNESTMHIMGLVGEGGVHAHQKHLLALVEMMKANGINKAVFHLFTDGRDSGPYDTIPAIAELEEILPPGFIIGTISGRYYAMDRDNNWDRLEKFTNLILAEQLGGLEIKEVEDWQAEIKEQYNQGKTDEHIIPFALKGNLALQKNDGIIVMNFRADRVRMLTSKLIEKKNDLNLKIATLTEYSSDYDVSVIYPAEKIENTLASEISKAGLSQAHIAETEKFPHATYFLNGGRENPHQNEEHVLLDSRKDVATHDEAPEMRAEAIADEAVKRVNNGIDFIFINFANPDMVGHTANVPAIEKAIEKVDQELKKVIEAIEAKGGVALITADHGNAELNIDPETGEKHTAHTLNLVPAILTDQNYQLLDGSLKDLAPTILSLLEIKIPNSMTGNVLVEKL